MSTDRDTTRVVRSWLRSTRMHASADRVLDALAVGLDTTPQHRATWWPVRRTIVMSNFAKAGLAAAAVVVAALLGYVYFAGPNVGGPGSDDPTPSPSASAASQPVPLPIAGTGLEPGMYSVSRPALTPIQATFRVPDGWLAGDPGGIAKNVDAANEVRMAFYAVGEVYTDACDPDADLVEIGPTADDLVEALRVQPSTVLSSPTTATIGGHPARRVGIDFPTSFDTTFCREPDVLQVWQEPLGGFFTLRQGMSASVYVVDVNGQRVVVTTTVGAESSDQHRAELAEIVNSIRFSDEP